METVERCDLCGASLSGAPAVRGLEHAPVVECPRCGLVITSPRPTPGELAEHYPDSYYAHVPPRRTRARVLREKLKAYRDGYPEPDPPPVRALWKAASALLGGLVLTRLPYRGPGRRLLDVGCGAGDALLWAAERGWEAHGVEIDPEAVRIARGRGLERVREGSLEEQRYPAAHFDAITLHQALEHMYSPTAVLGECRRILKGDGVVYVSVPNFDSLPRRALGERWYALQLPIHLHHFTPATLQGVAEATGFRVSRRHFYPAPLSAWTTLPGLRARVGGRARAALALLRATLDPAMGRLSDIMLFELRPPHPPPAAAPRPGLPGAARRG